ncbi:cyclic nucleotide-binding protein [Plantactinospora sp. BC1]|uniref:cyclic nucleotide-binding protein n=1 Tax=Plantactinospora sp. BC1 TaxID=2108470 RepID=UPI000D17031D|nr:cyclic nucleotide-binding protein [Plantactinospora sp. BC1]AVT30462.1 cyclic nucleotide-binding protein [Plantactinospora sp. BC1]
MAVVESRVSVWEALAGRAPGRPLGPADSGLWTAVVERLNPARARPVLRPGIERAELVSVRGVSYVMLRSPDSRGDACYLRLSPEEWRLAELMDGSRTVARLVAEFARIAGRLAPDQVTRVVADLAGNRMLAELPVDAFRPLDRVHRRPWPLRLGRGLLAAAKGQRTVVADVDWLVDLAYRAGGRLLFTRVAAGLLGAVAVAGLLLFGWTWWAGDQSLFLTDGSYAAGAAVLLGLNVLALACHELGHALATKHAGRRVPAAGFLVYFGIPSVFVDTTDVWMAGRRARMLSTAAGPAAGLILAGLAQLVGLLVPEAAPWTFKLAFAWYLNALFNLNPFLALDGYYLLMDWLEIPNLRARGLAYVLARLRRRPPSWAQLDREGRIVALYGTLAVLWVVVAVNIGWRIWTDRVAGLILGLWRSGWPARLLLVAVIAGLAAPLVYLVAGWLARRVRRVRAHWVQRRHRLDLPRRLDALRNSPLGRLPETTLAELAGRARWVRPRTGTQLVFAGAAQSTVFLVVDGAMEGRRPGDPGGLVRQRLGPGGVIGLASALTGAPATLDWHTAGTLLLGLPTSAVVTGVGPLPGPPPADRAEAEALFAEAPALRGLSPEDRLGLVSGARVSAVAAGDPIVLAGPSDAVVVESGVIELPDGTQLRRGTMIGPAGEGEPGTVATARTPVRVWALPAVTGLPLLFGTPGAPPPPADPGAPGSAPRAGVHPDGGYPPLAAPPGPPPPDADPDVDRRFERKLWWLVLLLLLLALLSTASNLIPGPAWAEMPSDRALLAAESGRVDATVDGRSVRLAEGDRLYVSEGDQIRVSARSRALLTFRGGATTVFCAGSRAVLGPLWSDGVREVTPHGRLTLDTGRMLADTESPSSAFAPLSLLVDRAGGGIGNRGAARYAAWTRGIEVSTGEVRVTGIRQPEQGRPLACGAGTTPEGSPAPTGTPDDPASTTPGPLLPTPSPTPSPTASPGTPGPTPSSPGSPPTPTAGTPGTVPTTTGPPSTPPRTTPPPTTAPPTTPTNRPPVIRWQRDPGGTLSQQTASGGCTDHPTTTAAVVDVSDDRDSGESLVVTVHWSGFTSGSTRMSPDGAYHGTIGPVPYPGQDNRGGTLSVWVTASDSQKAESTVQGSPITVAGCTQVTIR